MDGSIELYQNTTEGAEIFFSCNPGFVLAGRMTATCASNGMWTPDPASLTCTCEYLSVFRFVCSISSHMVLQVSLMHSWAHFIWESETRLCIDTPGVGSVDDMYFQFRD